MKPASLTRVLHVIEKTKCISFRKRNSLKVHQGSVLKVLSKTCGDIGKIMSKKHAVEKSKPVAQWATTAHHGASIMFGDTIIYDAQTQITLNLKQ